MGSNHLTSEDEETLVLRALLGDLKAFDALVSRFRRAIILVAEQTLGSREAAEDVAQEVFLLAFKALPQLQDPAKFSSWLYAITRHRARRVAMQASRSQATEPSQLDRLILTHSQTLSMHPAEEVARRSERAFVPEVLAKLPPEYQIVLQLRYYEEWPVAQIAEFLLLPITTVKWRLHQGRSQVRRYLTAQQEREKNEQKQHGKNRSAPYSASLA
jgi:RNA polymerase sigma-70 factor (ECF subfamily)